MFQKQSLSLSILRNESDTCPYCIRRRMNAHLFSFNCHRTGKNLIDSKQRPYHLCTPCAYQSRKPKNFSLFEFKRNIFHQIACKSAYFHDRFPAGYDRIAIHTFKLSADHHADKLFFIRLFCIFCADELTVPQHRHRIAYPERLFHTVGNINNRNILFFKSLNLCKQLIHFVISQRSGRLVHNEDLRILVNRPGNLQHLLLCDRKTMD